MWFPVRVLVAVIAFLAVVTADALAQSCGTTTVNNHQGMYLTDPSGQQTAVFDLYWGGALASLKYNNVEQIWGTNPGAMVQPAFFSGPVAGGYYYNPTQAGDIHLNPTPVFGAACNPSYAVIWSGTTDFSAAVEGYAVGNTVWAGQFNFNQYMTPYVITTKASFVANPGALPSYYLQLDQIIYNVHRSESKVFGFSLAGYTFYNRSYTATYPSNCTFGSTNCASSATPTLVAGLYGDANLTVGLAISTSPQNYFAADNNYTFWSINVDGVNQNRSANLWSNVWTIAPRASRETIWYVMPGVWNNALSFAQTHH